MFNTSGQVKQDKEMGKVIQLQGDMRKQVAEFLLEEGISTSKEIRLHGVGV